ncbi:MAG: MBL fold metallo-hydrolase [Azoarcus sp.]|jgi:hydroxyacylglutathione hydrolase|nr:MBL fold metallo-hydrolase [Azoarcus sp.]
MKGISCQANGIYTVDASCSGRSRLTAVHFVVDHGKVAVIDTGSNASVPNILTAFATLGIKREDVEWVILTHLHLDHAGGAGGLMSALPNARLVAHSGVVRHLSNPSRLWQKNVDVYGAAQAFMLYGRLIPVDERRIIASRDGMELPLGDRVLKLLDTPGHAWHHIAVWDEFASAFFTGDAFGISYREFDVSKRSFIFPAISPPHFEPVVMLESIARMVAHNPHVMYLAHYGKVTGVERLANDLFRLIHAQLAVAQAARGSGYVRHVEILTGFEEIVREECARQQWALNEEISLNLLRPDLDLNAQGLGAWLDRLQERRAMQAVEEEMDLATAEAA